MVERLLFSWCVPLSTSSCRTADSDHRLSICSDLVSGGFPYSSFNCEHSKHLFWPLIKEPGLKIKAMAEGTGGPSASGQIPAGLVISADKLMGQSKSSAEKFVDFKDLSEAQEDTNKLILVCFNCKCKVMSPGYGTLVEKEVGRNT